MKQHSSQLKVIDRNSVVVYLYVQGISPYHLLLSGLFFFVAGNAICSISNVKRLPSTGAGQEESSKCCIPVLMYINVKLNISVGT